MPWDFKDLVRIRDLSDLSIFRRPRVLVVTDGVASLGPEQVPANLHEDSFGMGHLMSVLGGVATVTKAHRETDPLGAPGVNENFDFSAEDLSHYDQIWLMGTWGSTLPANQRDAIARFMNAGGGVFATGDHASLGAGLASALPRVRSMRHWNAPPPLGLDRVDTTMPDELDRVVFENQSDDIPQRLRLKYYYWAQHGFFIERYPHPLLCGPNGPIDEFPDHMHEGEVVLPADLTDQYNLDGAAIDEYPVDATGVRVEPEIIAWGHTSGRASPEVMSGIHVGAPGPATPKWTGTVGVYNGHRANVGRVVVDSTWHHFFDINLIGDNAANRPEFTDPRKPRWQAGFNYSPAGQQVLAGINQYFRNIVRWLNPAGRSYGALGGLAVELYLNRNLQEVLAGSKLSAVEVGSYAWDLARLRHPPCTIFQIVIPPLQREWPIDLLPWHEPQPGPDDGPLPPWPIPPKATAIAALGGAILALDESKGFHKRDAETLADRMVEGASKAVIALAERQAREFENSASLISKMLDRRGQSMST